MITSPADSALIKALLECDSLGQVNIKKLLDYSGGQQLKPPDIDITDNVLTAKIKTDSLALYFKLKERYELKEQVKTEYKAETIEVNKLTKWQKIRLYIANAFLLILPVIIYFKIPSLKKWIKKLLP